MKICFPVHRDEGMESSLCGHFGSAPMFVVFDDETKTFAAFGNNEERFGLSLSVHDTSTIVSATDN